MTPPDEPIHSSHRHREHRHNNHNGLDDEAIAYINKTLNSYGVPTMNRKISDDKYRSFGDLRRSDSSYRSRRASQIDVNSKPKVILE